MIRISANLTTANLTDDRPVTCRPPPVVVVVRLTGGRALAAAGTGHGGLGGLRARPVRCRLGRFQSPGSGAAAGSDPGPRVADLATPPTHMTTYLRGHSSHGAVEEHDT